MSELPSLWCIRIILGNRNVQGETCDKVGGGGWNFRMIIKKRRLDEIRAIRKASNLHSFTFLNKCSKNLVSQTTFDQIAGR